MLLDELGAGVNRTLLGELAGEIERLNREHGYTFFVIEHDMDLIARLCDPVIVMAEGKVLTQGTMAEISAQRGGDRGLSRRAPSQARRRGAAMSLLRIEQAGRRAMARSTSCNGIDLAVEPGRISVIVGPNGAGKSTAMKAIFGLAQVRDGRILFNDARCRRGCRPISWSGAASPMCRRSATSSARLSVRARTWRWARSSAAATSRAGSRRC